MRNKLWMILSIWGAAALGAGCTGQGRVGFQGGGTTDNAIGVARVDTERGKDGMLRVTVTLRNKTGENHQVDVRRTFFDAKGNIVEQSSFEPIEINARAVSVYTWSSRSELAADYEILIRRP